MNKEQIEEILTKTFNPVMLKVRDDSHQHAGHNPQAAAGNTHFFVKIASKEFTGKGLVERHRMVNEALKAGLKSNIHALGIRAFSPEEMEKGHLAL